MTRSPEPRAHRSPHAPLVVGLLALLCAIAYAVHAPERALFAWTAAYGATVATTVAALVFVMALRVARARWWFVFRPLFSALLATAPLLIVFIVPLALRLGALYPWLGTSERFPPEIARAIAHQRAWNNPPFFLARACLYLLVWLALTLFVRRAEHACAAAPTPENAKHARLVAGAGLPIMAFTITFAAFDWLMSLQAGWVSNIYGLYVFTSGLVAAISVVLLAASTALVRRSSPEPLAPDHFHALSRLLLMAVILWAYVGFFQLLLVWIADLPHQVAFYEARAHGAWAVVDVILFGGRFALPFLLLLSRPLKRSPRALAWVASWLLVTTALDFAWLVLPSVGASLSPLDVAPFIAMFALSWAYGARVYQRASRAPNLGSAPSITVERAFEYRSS